MSKLKLFIWEGDGISDVEATVEYGEMTKDGIPFHPSFKGMEAV